jgi:hypothetical protein
MKMEGSTMSVTYHQYGATVLNAPIDHLRRDMYAILNVPHESVAPARHGIGSIDGALVEMSQPCFPLAIQFGDTTILEEVIDRVSGTHALTYRSTACTPEIAEYIATCTLQHLADAPHTTFIEWTREYRLDADADHDRIHPFVSSLVDQDQMIASTFAAKYDNAEVLLIDYTLGGA